MTRPATSHQPRTPLAPQDIRPLLVRLVINAAAPVLTYVLLRPHLHSDVTALVIGAAIPITYTCAVPLRRRRLDPLGVFAIACFAFGLLLVLATGGNELVFKIREDIWTGPLGLACLISVAAHRPLFFVALQLAARRSWQVAERIRRPGARRIAAVTTAVIGVILLLHAVVMVVLALATNTATFLAMSRPITLVIVGGGLTPLLWWIHRERAHQIDRPTKRP